MKRKDIENKMTERGLRQIDLVINENDRLATYCVLSNGTLKDYTNHVVNRKIEIWGYLKWENGKSTRIAFADNLF